MPWGPQADARRRASSPGERPRRRALDRRRQRLWRRRTTAVIATRLALARAPRVRLARSSVARRGRRSCMAISGPARCVRAPTRAGVRRHPEGIQERES
jgi:hypothetical protein